VVDEITLKEVLEKKHILEEIIFVAIKAFEDSTSLPVREIRLTSVGGYWGEMILDVRAEVHL